MTTYVIASNAAHARVFAHQVGRIREIDHLDHPESQAHAGDLRTGEGGKEGSGALHGNPAPPATSRPPPTSTRRSSPRKWRPT